MTVQWSTTLRNALLDAFVQGTIEAGNGSTAWAASTAVVANVTRIVAGGASYLCTTSGVTAATGSGPTGAGNGIADGTAVWAYLGPTPYANSTAFVKYQLLVANGNVYLCDTAGTTASTGSGPSTTAASITDGAAVFTYLGTATIGTSAIAVFYTGAPPANCAASASGTVLATVNLNSDWMSPASAGSKSMINEGATVTTANPYNVTASAAGNVGYYRIYASNGTTCHEQGTVTATGGGGDMTVDNVSLAAGQNFQITSYQKTAAGA